MKRYKKSIMLFAAIFFVSLQAFSQDSPVDKFINQYANDDRFTFVSVSPQMMSQISQSNKNLDSMHIKSTRILTTEKTPDQFYQEAVSKLAVPPYEVTMNVHSKENNVKFLSRKENGKIVETIMIVGEKDEFTLIDITGDNINIGNLGSLGALGNLGSLGNFN